MPNPIAPDSFLGDSSSDTLLRHVFDVSLTGIQLLRPVYAPGSSTVVDFAYVYNNPAGLRMLGSAQQLTGTLVTLLPNTLAAGILPFCQRAFAADAPLVYEVNYQAAGVDNYFRFSGQRSGEYLLVSFTDTTDQPRSAVEEALRQSQAAERAARAEAERQRQRLVELVEQAPAAMCVVSGPAFTYETFNPLYAAMFGGRPRVGQPMGEVLPEIVNHPWFLAFRAVYEHGRTIRQSEVLIPLARPGDGVLEDRYFSYTQQPRYDRQGQLDGVFVFAVEVTEQVLARQRVEQLNQELEARVQQRTQQLEAARAATEHERTLLQALLAQAPVAIALFESEDVRVASANDEMAAIWGYTPAQVVGRPLLEGVPELQGQGFDELLRQVLRTQVSVTGTEAPATLLRNGQLQTSYYNFVYQPLYDTEGQVLGVIDVAVDVTEQVLARRQVEQLNQELEARVQAHTREALALQADLLAVAQRQASEREAFYQIFEQTTAAVALLRGPEHRYDYVNPTFRTYFPNRSFVGHALVEVAPESVPQGFSALLDHVYQTGETFYGVEMPFVFAGATPRTIYFNFTYQAYREAGQVVGISIFALEVTEQVLVRQQQQAQAQRLRDVFAQAPVAIFMVRGADYVFDVVNASMGQLLSMAPDNMLGKSFFEVLPGLAAQGYHQLLDHVWHTGQEYVTQEQAAQLPHHGPGEKGYYNFTYVPLREADGRVVGIVCVAVDVTAQVLTRQQVQGLNESLAIINEELSVTNEELHDSNRQLMRTNVDLDTFVYTASHDLKAPITNIEGLLNVLQHHLPVEVQQEELTEQVLGMMHGAVERFQYTINQLTDVSRLQHEQNQPAEQVHLAAVVEDVRLDLQPLLTSTGALLTVTIGPELYVLFSPKNLRSVVYNLLSNALKYHHPGRLPVVKFRAAAKEAHVVLTIVDNGLGLNAQQQTRLFNLFQRLHTHIEGSGVGLYMVKRMVDNAGGTITVQSEEGVGTTFTVTLPTGKAR